MTAIDLTMSTGLARLYAEGGGDADFAEVIEVLGSMHGDVELAELIEADGRYRIARGLSVELGRYVSAIPDLNERPDPLDAAIDMALRWLARTSRIDDQSVRTLVATHPQLETAIREAAALSEAVWSTHELQHEFDGIRRSRELPCEFGPMMPDARRRYELRQLLGEGAFGQVFLAVDRQLSEKDHEALVSIKLLTSHDRSGWARHRFIEEATKARRINHPNVVRVIDRGVSAGDEDFIVYEFIDGGDLARWSRRQPAPMSIDHAVRMIAGVARGVHAAHMAGLVHCDLKPANVVVTTGGEPKVADFGIAIRPNEQDAEQFREAARTPMGNLAFMSPEQHNLEPSGLTIPTDVYALGGLLYWLLTEKLPNGTTSQEVARTHDPRRGRREAPNLRQVRREIDDDLAAICARAMAVKPEDRYSSAAALADDLESWLHHEPIAWTRPSVWRRIRLAVRRRPALAASLTAMMLIVAGSGFAIQRVAAFAHQRDLDAAHARERSDWEESMRQQFRDRLLKYTDKFRVVNDEQLDQRVLSIIWFAEWLYGPTVLGVGADAIELFKTRNIVIHDLIADARQRGRGDHMDTLIWESALAFWLVIDGQYDEGERMLAESEPRWRALLTRDDPWLHHLHWMHDCAAAGQLADNAAPDGITDEERSQLEEVAATLEQANQTLYETHPDIPVHWLVMRTLHELYSPALLDNHERFSALVEPLKKHLPRRLQKPQPPDTKDSD